GHRYLTRGRHSDNSRLKPYFSEKRKRLIVDKAVTPYQLHICSVYIDTEKNKGRRWYGVAPE
ncbi:hypothetical protein, partial [Bacteroides heparinolyticus]|uniref:hypothetical protein n=1 Tax=Prevotella heparinolytica TaxID=28113 RepID=UPI0035A12B9D